MKKTLIIILLSVSLPGFSQTEKGDFVITHTVGWNTIYYKNVPEDSEDFQVRLPIGFHKYLSDRFALGLVTTFGYYRNQPYVSNVYYKSQSYIAIQPEVRYNFLKTRKTCLLKHFLLVFLLFFLLPYLLLLPLQLFLQNN